MKPSPSSLPGPVRLLLRMVLPQSEFESLIGCYEKDYLQILNKCGRKRAHRWLFWQMRRAVPPFFRIILSGEISMFGNYLKSAFRNLKRHKGYSFINISGLAMGMACCLLIFLWVKHEWGYDRFHKNAQNIHRVTVNYPVGNDTSHTWRTPPPLAAALKTDLPEVRESSRFYTVNAVLVEQGQTRFKERIGFTDPGLFSIFTLPLQKGTPDTVLSDPQSAVISDAAALKFFGSENPIGKTLVLNDSLSFQVSAVMENIPPNSHLYCPILIPFQHLEAMTGAGNTEDWGDFGYNTFVLLEKSTTPSNVNAKLRDFLDVVFENPKNETALRLQPLTQIHLYSLGGGGPIVYIWIFSAIALFILLIACVNFMNLATARSSTRALEIGVRKVVGAGRRRLIQQFLCESLFLSIISLMFAFLIVSLGAKPLAALAQLPEGSRLLDPGIIPVFVLIAVLTGLFAGSYPALFLSSFQSAEVLKGRRRGGSPLFRTTLVVFQFAISVFLLIGLMLISRQIDYMTEKPLGFSKDHIVYVPINDDLIKSYEPFRQELLMNPGVSRVSKASNYVGRSPMWSTSSVMWEGKDPEDGFGLSMIYTDHDFAGTFGMELVDGRFFSHEVETDKDNFVLNETAIRGMDVKNPIGMELEVAGQKGMIIGILRDFHFRPLRDRVQPLVLVMNPMYFRYLAIRIEGENISTALRHVERVFKQISPKYPFEYRFLDEILDQQYQAELRSKSLLRYFVLLAGFISCLGLFGLASFMAQSRTKEIGIRKVLGASEAGIFVLLSRSFVRWVLAANLIAWPVAYFGMNQWLQNFAYRAPVRWSSFVLAAIISLGIALFTVCWQSIKVARTNPVQSLQYE